MSDIRIRILDDEAGKRNEFCKYIEDAGVRGDIDVINPDELSNSFVELVRRQGMFRSKGSWDMNDERTIFDETDVLIVDQDLREFFRQRIFTDADHVAYLARCFSSCKNIIIVNRISTNPFDTTGNLSYQDQFDAFSDLEIGQDQLASRTLWGTGQETFHPWYWFVPGMWLKEFEERVKDTIHGLQENLPILEFFGLNEFRDWLSPRILQTLGKGKDCTFREFVRNGDFVLAPRDRAKIPYSFPEETIRSIAPVVAARLWKWLEFQVLPELDILLDAPHLIDRFPSLLEGNHEDVSTWNAVAVKHTNVVPNLKMELVAPHRFEKKHWLTRPVWYWRKVMDDENIPDVREPWNIERVPFVFCENTSRFAPQEETLVYIANVESVFRERHLEKLDKVDYLPPQRLAM